MLSVDALENVDRKCDTEAGDEDAADEDDSLEACHIERVAHHEQSADEESKRNDETDDVHALILKARPAASTTEYHVCHGGVCGCDGRMLLIRSQLPQRFPPVVRLDD